MKIKKTLCKQCKQCKTHTYTRINRKNKKITFKYCKGNENIINKFNYGLSHPKTNPTVNIINSKENGCYAEERGKSPVRYMKKDKKNLIDYIDGNNLNLMLKNMREITKACIIHKNEGKTSIFPGVHLNHGKYDVRLKINGKTTYIGRYVDELEAYDHYVKKCEEIGRKVNKETEAHQKFLKLFKKSNIVFK